MRSTWITSLAVATATLAGAGAADAAPATAPSHVETAVPFVPRGYFHAPVYRWTGTEVSPWYRRAPAGGAPGGLRLTLTRDPLHAPDLRADPHPPRGELERLGTGVGKRLAKRAREVIEEALDASGGGGGGPTDDDDISTDEEGLVVETCGLAASWAGGALWDGSLDRGELDQLVDRAQDVGWDHAWRAGTRTGFAEAAYLGLTAADLAEGWRHVANDPGRYARVGLRNVRIDVSPLTPSLSFTEPRTVFVSAPRAEADEMMCRFVPDQRLVRRCVWRSPF